jgi:hypothetical protein
MHEAGVISAQQAHPQTAGPTRARLGRRGLVLPKSRMAELGSVPTTTRYTLRCESGRSAQAGDDRAVSLVRLDQL